MKKLVWGTLTIACLGMALHAVTVTAAAKARPVVVAEVLMRELAPVSWYTGTVISRERARLAAEVSGRLLWVADVGNHIEAQSVVARVDDTFLKQELAERKADVARIEARLGYLKQEASRLQRLATKNNAAQSQLEKTVSERVAAHSELKAAVARERRSQEAVERSQLRAPFTGVVTERLLHAGEWADDGAAVVAMTDPDSLEVQSWVSVSALPFIKTSETLEIRIQNRRYQGRVRTLVPVGELRSRLYELRLELPPGDWSVGESVRMAVPAALAKEVLAVPRDALVLRRDSTSVFKIDKDNVAHRIPVTTGVASGDYIQVQGDLEPGDRVVIRGGERLRPKQTVKIQNPDTEK